MTTLKLMVLYPIPSDVEQFEKDYADHLALFHNKMCDTSYIPLFYILDGVKVAIFRLLINDFYAIQNSKQAPPVVVQTSFE